MFIAIVLVVFSLLPKQNNKYLVIVCGGEASIDMVALMEHMKAFTLDIKLRSANKNETHQEMIFEIRTKGSIDLEGINKISEFQGVKSVNWVVESGESVG